MRRAIFLLSAVAVCLSALLTACIGNVSTEDSLPTDTPNVSDVQDTSLTMNPENTEDTENTENTENIENTENTENIKSVLEIVQAIVDSQPNKTDYANTLSSEDPAVLTAYLGLYGLEDGAVKDAAVMYAGSVQACEIAVLEAAKEDAVSGIVEKLQAYILSREGDFTGYAPDQAAILSNAVVVTSGTDKIALCICEDPDSASEAFTANLPAGNAAAVTVGSEELKELKESETEIDENGYIVYHPPGVHDMSIYPTDDILDAYRTGVTSLLSDADKAVLEACKGAIAQAITEDMSVYDQELAIHDWMILHIQYDETAIDGPGKEESATPYGAMVLGEATCLGYASSFQLIMDMLEIPAQLVIGATNSSTQDHAWNMVCLEDAWYIVDVTWDDPLNYNISKEKISSDMVSHRYFNVTSDFLRGADHQWDYAQIPEATGTYYSFVSAIPLQ